MKKLKEIGSYDGVKYDFYELTRIEYVNSFAELDLFIDEKFYAIKTTSIDNKIGFIRNEDIDERVGTDSSIPKEYLNILMKCLRCIRDLEVDLGYCEHCDKSSILRTHYRKSGGSMFREPETIMLRECLSCTHMEECQ